MIHKRSAIFMITEVFFIFLRLGLTSFGGPVAHIGYFRQEFVEKRKWFDSESYTDLVALCQFLPGPSSSQVGMAIGLMRAGAAGAVAAWLGFTLPSAIALIALGLGISVFDLTAHTGLLHGLKMVAAAVVAQAIWGMTKSHCADIKRALIGMLAAVAVLLIPSSLNQVAVILASAVVGILVFSTEQRNHLKHIHIHIPVKRSTGLILLSLFGLLLLTLPIFASQTKSYPIDLFAKFFQTGSMVFGGGHVVLPLLQSQVVPIGWISNDTFLAGYGLTQAVPGPLFTFAAFIGAASNQSPSGWMGGGLAVVAIFLPSFLMVIGIMPFWDKFRANTTIQKSMIGVNAAVVGILLAAFYNPIWMSAVLGPQDFALVVLFYLMLQLWKLPPWLVVIAGAGLGLFL